MLDPKSDKHKREESNYQDNSIQDLFKDELKGNVSQRFDKLAQKSQANIRQTFGRVIDLSNADIGDDQEQKQVVQSEKPDEPNLSDKTQSFVKNATHLDRVETNPIDDVEKLLAEIGESSGLGGNGEKDGEDELENDGNLTRLVEKF